MQVRQCPFVLLHIVVLGLLTAPCMAVFNFAVDEKVTHCALSPTEGYHLLEPHLSITLPGVMTPANSTNAADLPATLHGIWWLNNTQPTGLFSLANVKREPATPGAFQFPAYLDMGWSYDNSQEGLNGLTGWMAAFFESFWFRMTLDATQQSATFDPRFYNVSQIVHITTFTMQFVRDGLWRRMSTFTNPLSGATSDLPDGDYDVIRVVDADGKLEPAFQQWVEFNRARSGSDFSLLGRRVSFAEWTAKCVT